MCVRVRVFELNESAASKHGNKANLIFSPSSAENNIETNNLFFVVVVVVNTNYSRIFHIQLATKNRKHPK